MPMVAVVLAESLGSSSQVCSVPTIFSHLELLTCHIAIFLAPFHFVLGAAFFLSVYFIPMSTVRRNIRI